MSKTGTSRDVNRRRRHVSNLQDSQMWKEKRKVPEGPDERWPTALIVAPSSVVGNWEREFATVSILFHRLHSCLMAVAFSGATSRSGHIQRLSALKIARLCLRTSSSVASTSVRLPPVLMTRTHTYFGFCTSADHVRPGAAGHRLAR